MLCLLPARFARSEFNQVVVQGLALPAFLLWGGWRLAHTIFNSDLGRHIRDVSEVAAWLPAHDGWLPALRACLFALGGAA